VFNEIWVTVCGNVVEDPMQRDTVGAPVKFRLASTPAYLQDGTWRDSSTSYFDVVCWERLGENVLECVRRGDPVVVHGKLQIRDWESENGRGRSAEIKAQHLGFDLKRRKAMVMERPIRSPREETPVTTAVEAAQPREAAEALAAPAA
jgi:single-strand DNA-binding protein